MSETLIVTEPDGSKWVPLEAYQSAIAERDEARKAVEEIMHKWLVCGKERDAIKADLYSLGRTATERCANWRATAESYKATADAAEADKGRLRALFAKYRDVIASIHRSDWGEDSADFTRHTEEDHCWICDLIVPVDSALQRIEKPKHDGGATIGGTKYPYTTDLRDPAANNKKVAP